MKLDRDYCQEHKAWLRTERKTPPPCPPCATAHAARKRAEECARHGTATQEAANLRIIEAHGLPAEDCRHEYSRQTGGHQNDCPSCLEDSVVIPDPVVGMLQDMLRNADEKNRGLMALRIADNKTILKQRARLLKLTRTRRS